MCFGIAVGQPQVLHISVRRKCISGLGEDPDVKSKAICKKCWVTMAVGTKKKVCGKSQTLRTQVKYDSSSPAFTFLKGLKKNF